MNSTLAARPAAPESIQGCQTPRIISTPRYRRIETGRWDGVEDQEALDFRSPAGQECIELAESYGTTLDPWQRLALHHSLAEDDASRWAAFEVALELARQNGKGGFLEARQLGGVMLFGDKLIIHTAHQFKTAAESFIRLDEIISGYDDLSRRVKRVIRSHGDEGFEFLNGSRIRFLARSESSGRGFSGDLVIMDEGMMLRAAPMGALLPTMSARRNPQLIYTGSAGMGEESEQLGTLRARALAETEQPDQSLVYLGYSIDPHVKECARDERERIICRDHDDRDDPRSFARANPAMGIRIREEHIWREFATMRPDLFDRERLGVGEYPVAVDDAWKVIAKETWEALADGTSQMQDPVAFAVDVTPERSHAAIGAASRNGQSTEAGDVMHMEVIDHRPGTGWVVDRLKGLVEKWRPCAVVIDTFGPPSSLIPAVKKALAAMFEETGDPYYETVLIEAKTKDVANAYGQWIDLIEEQRTVHLDQAPLATALAGADTRPVGEGKTWARRGASVDISPLVAVTNAAYGHAERADVVPEGAPNLW
ncbi:terminase [Streptomyces sp. NPDC088182]|uniref:terminase n=1 Tax=Streptomyces sp. NPDC088182 TaxID=3365838 RepID=UPI0038096CA7